MADVSNLTRFLGDVADSIRLKKGTTEPIQPKDFDTEISTIDTSGLNTYDATATENDIVADKTAYANGEKITGTVTDNRGTIDEPKTVTLGDKTVTYTNSDNGYGGYMRIEMTPDKASVIDATSKVTTDVLGKVIADNVGLTPDILANGVTLLGVEGTHLGRDDITYTELEYIESTGTQYIDTEYIPTSTTKWVYDYQFLTSTSTENNASQNGCGITNDSKRFVITYFNDRFLCSIGVNGLSDVAGNANRHTFMLDAPNKQAFIDNTTISCPYTSFSATETICFFTRKADGNVSTYRHAGKLYNSQIYEDNVLVRDFIPVLDENGVPCLYDKVTKEFFYNQGTGSFIPGDGQVINYTMLYDHGDQREDITGGYGTNEGTDPNKVPGLVEFYENSVKLTAYTRSSGYTNSAVSLFTNNKINLTNYNKVGLLNYCKLSEPGSKSWMSAHFYENIDYTNKGENFTLISNGSASFANNEKKLYLVDLNIDEKTNKDFYLIQYMSSLYNASTNSEMYVYATFLTKYDNWQILAEKANIAATIINHILTESEKLLANEEAVNYMLHNCTGDFMASAILSETFLTALENSPYKTKIYANMHWAKFLNMVA